MSHIYKIAVIGGGSAGVMATIRSVLNNDETILFPGTNKDRKKSRERWVKKIENMPGHLPFTRAIEEPNRDHIKWLQESEFKEKLILKEKTGIVSIKKENGVFFLKASDDETYQAHYVILCTGVTDVQPKINDSIRDVLPYANKQTIDYCLRCDGHHVLNKEVAVIGHSNETAWVASMLFERYKVPNMIILTNGEKPEFDDTAKKLIEMYNIDVYEEAIHQVLGNPREGKLEGFVLCCGTSVNCDISFVSLGMIIYNELAKELGADLDKRGFVLTDSKGLTSIEGLYVAGDLRANTKKQVYTAWDTAVDSADAINSIIRREKRNRLLESFKK